MEGGDDLHCLILLPQLFAYLWVQLGAAVVLFLCVLVYFPDRPRDAPTISAGEKRTSFWLVRESLFHNVAFAHFAFISS